MPATYRTQIAPRTSPSPRRPRRNPPPHEPKPRPHAHCVAHGSSLTIEYGPRPDWCQCRLMRWNNTSQSLCRGPIYCANFAGHAKPPSRPEKHLSENKPGDPKQITTISLLRFRGLMPKGFLLLDPHAEYNSAASGPATEQRKRKTQRRWGRRSPGKWPLADKRKGAE